MVDSLLIVGTLALVVERFVDRLLQTVWPDVEAGGDPSKTYTRLRGIIGFGLVFVGGIIIVFAANLGLMNQIFGGVDLSPTADKWLTACLIGGGAAPAHEVIRYVENKKAKAKEEKASAEGANKDRLKAAQS